MQVLLMLLCFNSFTYILKNAIILIYLIFQTECKELHSENKRLREENEKLLARKVNLRDELLKKVLQSDESIKHFLGLPSVCFFTFFP